MFHLFYLSRNFDQGTFQLTKMDFQPEIDCLSWVQCFFILCRLKISMALLIVSRQIKYTYVQHVLINQNWPWSLFCFIVARVSISHIIHVFTKSELTKKKIISNILGRCSKIFLSLEDSEFFILPRRNGWSHEIESFFDW